MSNRIFALLAPVATVVICATESFAAPVGAPGPIAGTGLPILAIGYGAYWLAKRLRRKTG